MANKLIDTGYFKDDLFIPLAKEQFSSTDIKYSPNNESSLNNSIEIIEREVLINAFGLANYDLLQTALDDLPNADQKWIDLVDGVKYDDKEWEGLRSPKSLLAYSVYYFFLSQNSDFYTSVGVAKPNSENASNSTPMYKLTNAQNVFIEKYQKGVVENPIKYHKGTVYEDYYREGYDNNIVSLFQFLCDKKDDYDFDSSKFVAVNTVNSFGL